jgi:hypothetical protein
MEHAAAYTVRYAADIDAFKKQPENLPSEDSF